MFVTSQKAQKYYSVSHETLRQWAIKGEIEFTSTSGGHRRYKIIRPIDNKVGKKSYIYARVSSRKQENDLKRQIAFAQKKYPNHTVISDIGSGINEKRKGYKALLDKVLEGSVKEIVVAHKDRLSRFGFDLIKFICSKFGTKIIIIKNCKPKHEYQELTEDLMSIVTVFTARYHGKRKY